MNYKKIAEEILKEWTGPVKYEEEVAEWEGPEGKPRCKGGEECEATDELNQKPSRVLHPTEFNW